MDKFRSLSIQKFDGSNFQLWKFQMEIIFRAEGLIASVNGTNQRPSELVREERKDWDDLNAKAMLLISTSMEFSQLQTIMFCETAPEMWTRINLIHEQRSYVKKVMLKQHFFNYQMSETDTIAQRISKIESMAQALSDVEEKVSDLDKVAKVLGSLPYKYSAFVTAWDSYDEDKQTFDNLTARLLKEELRLSQMEE